LISLDLILFEITCVSFFLLAFIAFFNPLKVNAVANKWFSLFLFSVGCALLNGIIYEDHAEEKYSQLVAFNELSRFAMAPALYLSILHFTSPYKIFRKKEFLHFIPFLLFFIFICTAVILPGAAFLYPNKGTVLSVLLPVLMSLSVKVQVAAYWILSYFKLSRHQKNIQLVTSDTSPVDLNWLKYLLLGIAFMIALWFNALLFKTQTVVIYSSLGYLAGALFICYFLLAQKEVYPYEKTELADINSLINEEKGKSSAKKRVPDEQLTTLKNELSHLMDTERLYLDSELGLPQLAKSISLSPHDLSYLLNEGFGMNFFQFVNTYRIEEAKRLLLSEKHRHLNILGIAYSSGFNSKTTFNTAFKRSTGFSPSQFIQHAKPDAVSAAAY